jgi:glycosyltransferase involved in cell wall biosynthesis
MNPALRRLKQRASVTIRRDPARPVVRNANGVRDGGCERSALIVYLPDAFLIEEGGEEWLRHQNRAACKLMARVLGEMGYLVDVVHKHDRRFRPRRPYDLVVGERRDWNGVEALLPAQAVSVFLATSPEHGFHNRALERRHERLKARRPGSSVALRRVNHDRAPAVEAADAITGPGNGLVMETWAAVSSAPAYPFNNFGWEGTRDSLPGKDFDEGRSHFLFFASGSQVMKGLDLLLEVFPRHPDLHLHVCSDFAAEPDFCEAYREELFETPNVHPVGFIRANGPRFDDLARRCAWVILPGCSEGQPGSVVQCMHAGLVPVVTREAGIDAEDFGLLFAGDETGELERTVLDAAGRDPEWVRERAALTRRAALAEYTAGAFAARWREIIEEVIVGAQALRGQPRH